MGGAGAEAWAYALISAGAFAVGGGLYKLGRSIGELTSAMRDLEVRVGSLERKVTPT